MAKCAQYGAKLKNMTAQEVFNLGANHLLTQNAKSVTSNGNAYMGDGGMACGASPFLRKYTPSLDDGNGLNWGTVVDEKLAYGNHRGLIGSLQGIHDAHDVNVWLEALIKLGKEHNLNIDFLNGKY